MAHFSKILGGDSYNRYKLIVDITHVQRIDTNDSKIDYAVYLYYDGEYSHGRFWDGGSSAYLKQGSTTWASKDFSYDFRGYRRLNLFSGSKIVSHGTDGKLTLKLQAYVHLYNQSYPGMTATLDISLTLPTIPRASTFVSAEGYWTEGSNPKIVMDKKYSGYTHKLTVHMSVGSGWIFVAGPLDFSGTSYTVPLTGNSTYIDRIYKNSPNHLGYTLRYTVGTYSGSTLIGSAEKSVGCKNQYAKPTISGMYYKDRNAAIVGKTGSDQRIVQTLSDLAIGAKLTATNYATLKRLEISIAGKNYAFTAGGTTEDRYVGIGKVDKAVNSATLKAVDSRGQETAVSLPFTMIPWVAPQLVHASADRRNSYEQDTYFNSTLRRSIIKIDGADINESRVEYRVKPKNSSTWGEWVDFTPLLTSTSGNTATEQVSNVFMDNYPNDEAFDLQFAWKDLIEDVWRTRDGDLSKGIALMSFYEDMIKAGVDLYVKDSKVITEANNSLLPYTELTTNGYSNKNVGYYVKNRSYVVVTFDYLELNTQIAAWGTHVLATLPVGHRPIKRTDSVLFAAVELGRLVVIYVGQNGEISLQNYTGAAIPAGTPFTGSVGFPI